MTAPDSFATADQAAAYGYTLPDAAADALLARATQAIRDAAGIPVTQATSTLRVQACRGWLELPSPVVTAVSSVALVNDDDTTTAETDWRWQTGSRIRLGHTIPERDRHHGLFEAGFTHGFAEIPDALVMLTGAVAYRLSVTPVAAAAGIRSQTVGSVSWTAGDDVPGSALTQAEIRQLTRIVPVRHLFQVPL
jgi:hypothetical protein